MVDFRRAQTSFAIIFLITIFRDVVAQGLVDERNIRKCDPNLNRPTDLETVFINGVGATHVALTWTEVPRAAQYYVRIYRMLDDVLSLEIGNIFDTFYNVTGLKPSTFYRATVAAGYSFPDSVLKLNSCDSDPTIFETHMLCRGGQVLTQCTGDCVASCDIPDPICSRICTPGCNCPAPFYIWHAGQCVPPLLCPAKRETVRKPKNLRITPLGNSLVLSWDQVDGAVSYNVKVRLSSNRRVIVQEINTEATSAHISGLTSGEVYSFIVSAIMSKPIVEVPRTPTARSFPAPDGVTISNIAHDGFLVTWSLNPNARRYALVVYLEDKTTVIYSNSHIPRGTVQLVDLAPDTTYYVAASAAGYQGKLGELSPLKGVHTSGTKDPEMDYLGASISAMGVGMETTTEAPTTTPLPLTSCQIEYAFVAGFYERNPSGDGPSYPSCTADGLYKTTKCPKPTGNSSVVCHCIDANTGRKKFGSDYAVGVSGVGQIPLDCDNYGDFVNSPSNVQATNMKATTATLSWTGHQDAFGYIIAITSDVEFIQTVIEDTTAILQLSPGTEYSVQVMSVSIQGWTSESSTATFTTLFVDIPQNLKVTFVDGNSATVRWDRTTSADSFNVVLINEETGKVEQNVDVLTNRVTFTQLAGGKSYIVQVRSVSTREGIIHRSAFVQITVTTQCSLSRLDLVFVVDISSAVGFNALEEEREFFAEVAKAVPPVELQSGTRIAAVKYFYRATTIFNFLRFQKSPNVIGAVKFIRYAGRPVRRGVSLGTVFNDFFDGTPKGEGWTPRNGGLPVVIVFVGGPSRDNVVANAKKLREATNVIAVGIEGTSSKNELDQIASSPDNIVVAPSYDELNQQVGRIMSIICNLASAQN